MLGIYTKLMNGCLVNKVEEAQNYGVNERSIQRDIDDIRNFLELDSEIQVYKLCDMTESIEATAWSKFTR